MHDLTSHSQNLIVNFNYSQSTKTDSFGCLGRPLARPRSNVVTQSPQSNLSAPHSEASKMHMGETVCSPSYLRMSLMLRSVILHRNCRDRAKYFVFTLPLARNPAQFSLSPVPACHIILSPIESSNAWRWNRVEETSVQIRSIWIRNV